jgi:hypothetical protein
MSQCDYIEFIRTGDILGINKLDHILTGQDYTTFERFALETTVPNIKNSFSRLMPQNTPTFQAIFPNTDPVRVDVFDMEKKVSTTCPTFKLCNNTNTRPNRVLNSVSLPKPTYRLNKNHKQKVCQYKYGKNIVRTVWCGKKICKCRGKYITLDADPSIKKAYYNGSELTI